MRRQWDRDNPIRIEVVRYIKFLALTCVNQIGIRTHLYPAVNAETTERNGVGHARKAFLLGSYSIMALGFVCCNELYS